jgi:hypothetical protein
MPIKPFDTGKSDGFICKINNWLYIKVINIFFYILILKGRKNISIYKDSRYKRLEETINVENYRVSITNSYDSISHKGYTFKVILIIL